MEHEVDRRRDLRLLLRLELFARVKQSTTAQTTSQTGFLFFLPGLQFLLSRLLGWNMDGIDSLGGLRGLYQDLSVITDSSIVNIERLCLELESHLHDFRILLDKPSKNDNSRKSVLAGE